MNLDLSTVLAGAMPKLAAAGLLAVSASVASTWQLRSDLSHLTAAVNELRVEVKQMRADLYVPKTAGP